MPVDGDPNDTRDTSDVLRPAQAAERHGRRYDPVEWIAGTLIVVTGAVFAFCLVVSCSGIGQEPDMNAIQKAPANVLAANAPQPKSGFPG